MDLRWPLACLPVIFDRLLNCTDEFKFYEKSAELSLPLHQKTKQISKKNFDFRLALPISRNKLSPSSSNFNAILLYERSSTFEALRTGAECVDEGGQKSIISCYVF